MLKMIPANQEKMWRNRLNESIRAKEDVKMNAHHWGVMGGMHDGIEFTI